MREDFYDLKDKSVLKNKDRIKITDKSPEDYIKEKELKEDVMPEISFKYDEDLTIFELENYIRKTYNQHYVGEEGVQSFDLILSRKSGTDFCLGNIIKYASRFGFKKGQEKADIFKILHYAVLLYFAYKKENTKEEFIPIVPKNQE